MVCAITPSCWRSSSSVVCWILPRFWWKARWGASLRASQYLILAGKARALLNGRFNVSVGDIQALAYPVMRHRILTNFHAESQKITTDEIIRRLLEAVPTPKSGL